MAYSQRYDREINNGHFVCSYSRSFSGATTDGGGWFRVGRCMHKLIYPRQVSLPRRLQGIGAVIGAADGWQFDGND